MRLLKPKALQDDNRYFYQAIQPTGKIFLQPYNTAALRHGNVGANFSHPRLPTSRTQSRLGEAAFARLLPFMLTLLTSLQPQSQTASDETQSGRLSRGAALAGWSCKELWGASSPQQPSSGAMQLKEGRAAKRSHPTIPEPLGSPKPAPAAPPCPDGMAHRRRSG